jgi:hypothetical protein
VVSEVFKPLLDMGVYFREEVATCRSEVEAEVVLLGFHA